MRNTHMAGTNELIETHIKYEAKHRGEQARMPKQAKDSQAGIRKKKQHRGRRFGVKKLRDEQLHRRKNPFLKLLSEPIKTDELATNERNKQTTRRIDSAPVASL